MRVSTAVLTVALAVLAAADPSIKSATAATSVLPKDSAIFKAASSASTSTSFTIKTTTVTVVKHSAASSSASDHAASFHPKLVVTDAAKKGLVCLPKGSIKKTEASAETVATVTGGEVTKSDLVVGQGEGIHASVGASASASAGAGGASAAAASGGASAAAASGGGGASSAASGGGAAAASSAGAGAASSAAAGESASSSAAAGEGASAAASSGDSSSTAASGGHAEATGESSSAASSTDGHLAVDISGENAEAAAYGGGTAIKLTGEGFFGWKDESSCWCTPEYLCDEEGFINQYGAGQIDIRTFSDRPKIPRVYKSKCDVIPNTVCCRFRDGEDQGPIGWNPTTCGERAPIPLDKREVGGEAARLGAHPWMVALMHLTAENHFVYVCGGSLVAENVVLTAAHCVYGDTGEKLYARVGEWDTLTESINYPHQDIKVVEVVTHEGFKQDTLFNDVALLKLEHPAEIAPHVNTICLPGQIADVGIDYDDCFATGWGKDSFDHGVYSSILKEVHLQRVDHDVCQAALQGTRLGQYFHLHETFTCAGGEPYVDTCKGDGGSPLVCAMTFYDAYQQRVESDQPKFVQVGIVSWGIGCGKGGLPGVYVDVEKLHGWIQPHLITLQGDEYL